MKEIATFAEFFIGFFGVAAEPECIGAGCDVTRFKRIKSNELSVPVCGDSMLVELLGELCLQQEHPLNGFCGALARLGDVKVGGLKLPSVPLGLGKTEQPERIGGG